MGCPNNIGDTFLINARRLTGMFRILLAVDLDEERALASARAVTSFPKADELVEVTILNVEENVDIPSEGGRVSSKDWYDEADVPPSVERAKTHLEDAGISVNVQRKHGNPAEQIIGVANEMQADRIVMSGRKRTAVGKVLFGSVTQAVLLNSEIPVTVSYQ